MKLKSVSSTLLPSLILIFNNFVFVYTTTTPPDVRWSCSDTSVLISVQTVQPFEGLIKARGATAHGCFTRGIGTNLSVLKLDFNRTDCGMKYDQEKDFYTLTVDVHSHPILIIDSDQSVNISCHSISSNSSTVSSSSDSSSIYLLEIYDKENFVLHDVRYASPYSIRISSFDRTKDFTVGKCIAFSEKNEKEAVQLTDFRGCSVFPTLFQDFVRGPTGFTSIFPSMFKFPSNSEMTITCDIHPCDAICEDYDCNASASNEIPKILEETTTMEIDSETETASTVIKVLEKKTFRRPIIDTILVDDVPTSPSIDSTTKAQNIITSTLASTVVDVQHRLDDCVRPTDVDIMYALCIFLTVCSTIGFSINIIFGCLLWRNRRSKASEAKVSRQTLSVPSAGTADFWILDSNKIPDVSNKYEATRTVDSFASVKQKPRRSQLPILDYGMPTPSRTSDGSSRGSGRELSTDIYRRPDNRHSQSTFMTPSTTMETDLDSSVSSNQASSYH